MPASLGLTRGDSRHLCVAARTSYFIDQRKVGMVSGIKLPQKKCTICGSKFKPGSSAAKYCSPDCRVAGRRATSRRWRQLHAEELKAASKRRYQENKPEIQYRFGRIECRTVKRTGDKQAARRAVTKMVAAGALIKPEGCSKCGCIPIDSSDLEGHHADHVRRPLDVEWLCLPCHRRADVELSMLDRAA